MITYTDFITQYPIFAASPYVAADVTDKLLEVAGLFPAISDCLPPELQMLATRYGLLYLYNQENLGCYGGREVIEEKSLSDLVIYNVVKGKPGALTNDTWGNRLVKLFLSNGCYHLTSESSVVGQCDRCGGDNWIRDCSCCH